jgi:hypothetical protein
MWDRCDDRIAPLEFVLSCDIIHILVYILYLDIALPPLFHVKPTCDCHLKGLICFNAGRAELSKFGLDIADKVFNVFIIDTEYNLNR